MTSCAYCDRICSPTREHVVPRWYEDTPGKIETFSARAPLTHIGGAIQIKDVCPACNSGILSTLDAYGKELYERYFSNIVYAGESILFDMDVDRLVRWLLKLSFNSARVQNADVRHLRTFRSIILGAAPLVDQIRCYVHLVTPTYLGDKKAPRQARREDGNDENVAEPLWFRLVQLRLPSVQALEVVQRQVHINSFAFTLLIAPLGSSWPNPEFEHLNDVFLATPTKPARLGRGRQALTLTPGEDHAWASISPLYYDYPNRYLEERNPYIEKAINGEIGAFSLHIPHDMVEQQDVRSTAETLHDMVSTRERAAAFRQRVALWLDGYDDDPRELSEIPETRDYLNRLFIECPFVFLLAHPEGGMLPLLMSCWLHAGEAGRSQEERVPDFLQRAFLGMNEVMHRLAMSEEAGHEIVEAGMRTLFGSVPDL